MKRFFNGNLAPVSSNFSSPNSHYTNAKFFSVVTFLQYEQINFFDTTDLTKLVSYRE